MREKRNQLLVELRGIAEKAKADGRDFTDEETARIGEIKSEVENLQTKIKAQDDAAAVVKGLGLDLDAPDDGRAPPAAGDRLEITDRQEKADAAGFGAAFTKSAEYTAFRKAHPSGVGSGSPINIGRVNVGGMKAMFKAPIAAATGRVQNVRVADVDLVDRPELTLLDLVTRGETDGSFEYLQITSVTRNAAVVAEATATTGATPATGLKPLSDLSTQLADAKVYTYADGYDVTNQMLSDAPALATYIDAELRYSLPNLVEDKLLNGTGVSGEPKGILNTTGIQTQSYDTDMVTSIRKGITRVTKLGGSVTAVLMSPEDDEAWDLLKDNTGRYYGGGPFGSGPGTAWGRPRVVSQRLAQGTVILGDFRQVALLDREGLSIVAFNQHKDYAQRNLTYIRAELRAAQAIWKPSRLVKVATKAAA